MGRPFLYDAIERPLTSCIIAVLLSVAAVLVTSNSDPSVIGLSYDSVVVRRKFYRIVSSAFAHTGIVHLAFNCTSLWELGGALERESTVQYAAHSLLLVVLPPLMMLFLFHLAGSRFGMDSVRQQYHCGYSAVLFGLYTIVSRQNPSFTVNYFGIDIAVAWVPWASLVFTQLVVPHASLTGHLSGIAVGYVLATGALSLLSTWPAVLAMLACTLLGAAWSARSSGELPTHWFHGDEALYALHGFPPGGTGPSSSTV